VLGVGGKGQCEIFQKQPHAQRGDDGGDARRGPQGLVGQSFDDDAQTGHAQHGDKQRRDKRQLQINGQQKAEKRSHHEQIAVGEVDHRQDAVNHRVAQGDERVDAAQLQGV